MALPKTHNAIWIDKCTSCVYGSDEQSVPTLFGSLCDRIHRRYSGVFQESEGAYEALKRVKRFFVHDIRQVSDTHRVRPEFQSRIRIGSCQLHNAIWIDKCTSCVYGSDEQSVPTLFGSLCDRIHRRYSGVFQESEGAYEALKRVKRSFVPDIR
ncbi:hypothetical protein L3X38_004433 [Prunus dulcis]|uniref:Uncharacterized protein n=1 Tax=Prunus dulcis TaxID=3755 RepID=A0AAD5F357_PRUDU|nr:hypothetical protein L3X38_004433 [Prunus dulcis]